MAYSADKIRNVAIIAHIDHGKTTLLDAILKQSGVFRANEAVAERVMDSNDLERERGITIYSKQTSVVYGDYKINIVDTPGHADFGGEVERVLNTVNGVLLLVDATEGPMPQTRFVLKKSMELHLKPIVVINKIDRPTSRLAEVHDEVLDLFIELGADENQIDFPYVFVSALGGYAKLKPEQESEDLMPLFQMIVDKIPAPKGDANGPLLLQVSTLEYNDYLGKLASGRILSGRIKPGDTVARLWMSDHQRNEGILPYRPDAGDDDIEEAIATPELRRANSKVTKLFGYQGLKRVEIPEAEAGDIALIAGLDDVNIGDTVGALDTAESLPYEEVDRPTLSVNFVVNDSPFAGREGKYLTMRKVRERLEKELKTNVSLRIEETDSADSLKVSGRGELHLSTLIETMRREGYEMQISRPRVITRHVNGELQEPIEFVRLDLQEEYVGTVMEEIGKRRGELLNMVNNGAGLVRIEYLVPTRGLIGLRPFILNSTRGTGILSHQFEKYDGWRGAIADRSRGVLVVQEPGKSTAYSLGNLQDRAVMFIGPQEEVYEGMIIGENSRTDDMVVNVARAKKLTNMRAAGSDDNVLLTPPREMTLEQALSYIADDEFVEVTPKAIRLRKRHLKYEDRVRAKKRDSVGAGA
ncbi:MAG: GTP-binding protein [Candidatus Sumerlaeaceae bacterium]|nr:GTP-binding protein [Candidatus Sumerlaeaceae bacterium]